MNNHKKIKIGIFDSGLGGLTVFKALASRYRANISFIYLGDLAHLPYGSKSQESIIKYSQKIIGFFIKKKVDIIIVACNSASSVALPSLKTDIPIVGTINPSIQTVLNNRNIKSIALIGTEATIKSKAYHNQFIKYPKYSISSVACPLFVPLVEQGWENTDIAYQVAIKYLSVFNGIKLDSVILACTHYPMLMKTLKITFDKLGHKNLNFIDSGESIANYLSTEFSLKPDNNPINLIDLNDEFYVTDTCYQFNSLANRFLGAKIHDIHLIKI